ncbi:MAG: threonylcarbamoyl-AMP synthase [Candidatus Thermoplasmatota archaeon]|nr:threonylcarbamoyl-AMP synthase [Candidatus Thermoplasmatota archaeon]MBU1941078.1 threonylcarbamoyl-AMP synthase [Candidatus Thermoplasmatota archaeon]
MDTKILQSAREAIHAGKLIIYPTDTQYALGCTITKIAAIKKIYKLKQRPHTLPLPIAVASKEEITTVGIINNKIAKIIDHFLPGPLTIIIQKQPQVPSELTAGKNTIAVRIPNHPIALTLLQDTGPLTVTSSNIHGQKPYEDITDIQNAFKSRIAVYIPGGLLNQPPSTIVDLTKKTPHVLRTGPISLEDIIDVMQS